MINKKKKLLTFLKSLQDFKSFFRTDIKIEDSELKIGFSILMLVLFLFFYFLFLFLPIYIFEIIQFKHCGLNRETFRESYEVFLLLEEEDPPGLSSAAIKIFVFRIFVYLVHLFIYFVFLIKFFKLSRTVSFLLYLVLMLSLLGPVFFSIFKYYSNKEKKLNENDKELFVLAYDPVKKEIFKNEEATLLKKETKKKINLLESLIIVEESNKKYLKLWWLYCITIWFFIICFFVGEVERRKKNK